MGPEPVAEATVMVASLKPRRRASEPGVPRSAVASLGVVDPNRRRRSAVAGLPAAAPEPRGRATERAEAPNLPRERPEPAAGPGAPRNHHRPTLVLVVEHPRGRGVREGVPRERVANARGFSLAAVASE